MASSRRGVVATGSYRESDCRTSCHQARRRRSKSPTSPRQSQKRIRKQVTFKNEREEEQLGRTTTGRPRSSRETDETRIGCHGPATWAPMGRTSNHSSRRDDDSRADCYRVPDQCATPSSGERPWGEERPRATHTSAIVGSHSFGESSRSDGHFDAADACHRGAATEEGGDWNVAQRYELIPPRAVSSINRCERDQVQREELRERRLQVRPVQSRPPGTWHEGGKGKSKGKTKQSG
eukprot:6458696-Amphidinium_carterae.1